MVGLGSFLILYLLPTFFNMGYFQQPVIGLIFCPLLGLYGAYYALKDEEYWWMLGNLIMMGSYFIFTWISYQVWLSNLS